MSAPAGGEIAIYNSSIKRMENRIAVGLDYPVWDADKADSFAAALERKDWMFTQFSGGSGPEVTGGNMNIRVFGQPPKEFAITRPHWFPTDPNQAFELEINMTFPQTDPKYPSVVMFGAIDLALASYNDMLLIQQPGTNDFSSLINNSAEGDEIFISHQGEVWTHQFDGSQVTHEYIVQWDPQKNVNANIFRFLVDGVQERVADPTDKGPFFVQFGFVWPNLVDRDKKKVAAVLGSPEAGAQTVLQVHDITVRELGAEGHETRVYPGWTFVNAGGDLDTAADGERFALDGETFAKLPQQNLVQATVDRGRVRSDTFKLQLSGPDPDDPETLQNRFKGDRFLKRPLLIDTRVANDAGTFTAWKRQIAAVIEEFDTAVGPDGAPQIMLSGRDIPSHKADTFISRTFTDVGSVDGIDGGTSVTVDFVLERLVDISDIVSGFILGATAKSIFAPAIVVQSISTGGQSLLPVLTSLADTVVQEYWRDYSVTGTQRYGRHRVNTHTFGSGTPGYTFVGRGGTGANSSIKGSIRESRREGFGQVFYRQDLPKNKQTAMFTLNSLPIVSRFPNASYPPDARVLNDSIAWSDDAGAGLFVSFKNKANTNVIGTIASFRWRRENSYRRVLDLEVVGHDWVEPCEDEIAWDDPDHTGLPVTETFVVDHVSVKISRSRIISSIKAYTSDPINAIIRAT